MTYLDKNWQRHTIYREVQRVTPRDLVQARQNVEATYIIRLFAEFEGVLKDHLAVNHPRISTPARPRVDWLISRVIQVESLAIDPLLRWNMDAVRDYRNSIAHRKRIAAPAVTLVAALSTLNTFVARLPDPLT